MKIKSLLFAALVAGFAFTANAEVNYTNCGDVVSAPELVLEPGQQGTVQLYLTRQTSPDFTNIQLDVHFPEGIRPAANAKGKYTQNGADTKDEDGAIVTFSDNFNRTDFYPNHRFVGANMTKTPITANPCHMINIFVKADEDMKGGDYTITADCLKYTAYCDDSYATWDDVQNLCKVTVTGTVGVNDLKVNDVKTYKTIENGQVIIVKGETRYNTMGQIVK